MSVGKYERTHEIKEKQSLKMKAVTRNKSDEEKQAAKEKQLKSIKARQERGDHFGRPPKGPFVKKTCPQCGNDMSSAKANDLKKKFCGEMCYHASKKGRQPISSDILKSMDRSYMQTDAYRKSKQKAHTKEFVKYRRTVNNLTEKTYVAFFEEINPQSFPRTINGVEGGYQLDHIKSVKACFNDGDSVEFAARKENLQMLPWKDNLTKGG